MDIAFLLGTKIIELTLIVLIGYGLVKSKLLKSEDSKPLSIIGLYVISPAVMIEAFQIDYTPEILQGLQLSLLMAVFLQVILIIIGSLLKRLLNLDPIEHATSIYSNSGNLIIPIVMSLFGKEWVIYINIWSILVGAFLFAFQIKLPNIINGTLSSIGLFIGPNAMLVAGMLIAAIPLKSIVSSKRIYLVTLLRLLLIPILLLVLIKLIGFADWIEKGEIIVLISFLATTSPSAATVTQMAVIYNNNPQKASAIYGVTTLLCMFTMPLVIALYQMWG